MEIKTKTKWDDWGRVENMLTDIAGRAPANAARALRRASRRIAERAKIYVPEDTTALRESIRVEEARDPSTKRIVFRIVVGGQGPVKVPGTNRVVDLDQYAIIIHERYDEFKPGEGTVAKRAMYGSDKVGAQFLTRAYEDDQLDLAGEVFKAVNATIRDQKHIEDDGE